MIEYTRHHYIPECYLTNFTEDGKGIWVYNKELSKSYQQSISNIFNIKNFYRIDEKDIPETLRNEVSPLYLERDYFADGVEKMFSICVKDIIQQIDELSTKTIGITKLSDEFVEAITLFLVIQFLRTPKARDYIINLHSDTLKQFTEALNNSSPKENDFIKGMKLQLEIEKSTNYPPVFLHANRTFANNQVVEKFTEDIKNNIWQIYVSNEDYFFSSDSPIITELLDRDADMSDLGLNAHGAIITYPLTKKILIRIFERKYFSGFNDIDRNIIWVDKDFIQYENAKQFWWADKYIVSANNNFSWYLNHGG